MNPVCSATPRPSIATRTTPKGGKLTKVLTIAEVKPVSASPDSMFRIWMGAPLRGSTSLKATLASNQDATATTTSSSRNSMAGSGSLLPACSMASSARARNPGRLAVSGDCKLAG